MQSRQEVGEGYLVDRARDGYLVDRARDGYLDAYEMLVHRHSAMAYRAALRLDGSDITEEEHEMTLHAERPVTSKDTVPVERVRLGKETVTQDHEVSETPRKEQIDDPGTDLPGASR